MKFTILKTALLQTLNIAFKLVPSASASPVLTHFFMKIDDNGLEVKATDGNISCKTSISIKDDKDNEIIKNIEEGEFLVNGKYLINMISGLDGKYINFNMVDSNYLSIFDDATDFNLVTRETSEFPDLDLNVSSESNSFHIKVSDLKLLYDKTSFAVATKSSKDMFFGINIKAKDGKLYFLATDSFRMARYAIKNENDKADFNFTCPVKALSMISSLANNDVVEIVFDQQRALFKTNNLIVSTKLYQGDFPSPERIIPDKFPYSITFKTDDFLKSLGRVNILSDIESSKIPTCKLTISKQTGVTLSSSSEGNGDSKDTLSSVSFVLPENEEVFEIGFNTSYVQAALKALNSDEATLVFSSPIRMFMAKNIDENNIQIITPVRLSN